MKLDDLLSLSAAPSALPADLFGLGGEGGDGLDAGAGPESSPSPALASQATPAALPGEPAADDPPPLRNYTPAQLAAIFGDAPRAAAHGPLLKCQRQPGEPLSLWWDRTAAATDILFEIAERRQAGTLPRICGRGLDQSAAAAPPPIPKHAVPYFIVSAGGSLRVVEGEKAAAKYKHRVAVTWPGAGRWWYLPGAGESGDAVPGDAGEISQDGVVSSGGT